MMRICHFPLTLLLTSLFLIIQLTVGFGQQLPQFALTSWSLTEMNPAATGAGEDLIFNGAARRQWNALPGSPSGYHISAHMPFPAIQSGLGISLLQDQIGLLSNLEATILYAYHLPISREWTLSGGIAAGLFQSGLDGSSIRTPDGQYPDGGGIDHQDGQLPVGQVNALSPLIHAGAMVSNQQWTVGSSFRYAQGGKLSFTGSDVKTALQIQPHVMLHASWQTAIGDLAIMPTTVWMSDLSQVQATTQCYLTWRERFILGGGYRGWSNHTQDAILLTAGVHVSDRFLFMYAYESGLSPLKQTHNGSFELMIQYRIPTGINKGKLPGIIYNPRFL
ncbi:MAG: PorP/SprF family type IX secretion system membrane protein [Saprospiraceae bacterium]|nr:PorP/SprF family type IX secretion system membrane protein [Saprospiraceae bacterium]